MNNYTDAKKQIVDVTRENELASEDTLIVEVGTVEGLTEGGGSDIDEGYSAINC